MAKADIAIIGAGIAGASLAAEIGGRARVLLLEAESHPGYHATGRSAAFWSETYGGPAIQPLTTASGDFLREGGFLGPRGELTVAQAGAEGHLEAMLSAFDSSGVALVRRGRAEIAGRIPGLRPGWDAAIEEPGCTDIDVAALHAHYLASAKRAGVQIACDAEVLSLDRAAGGWRIDTRAGAFEADIVVDAAGAWAGGIAAMAGAAAIAIRPYRRTVVQLVVDPPAPAELPLIMDAAGRFYLKPEAGGRIWLSPHDETPSAPCDAAPEEIDVATAIAMLEMLVDWRIVRRERAWAGLRSFAPDRAPVFGFDAMAPGFFWFAGQGGFGIQTAPAAARLGASLLMREAVDWIDAVAYAPTRFR